MIRLTIIPFQRYQFCQKSLSNICTIRYTLFSVIITLFFQESGFCKKNSTETALIKINDDLLFNLEKDRV